MATIRARCPSCGIVELDLSAISLSVEVGVYAFTCPKCGDEITRVASRTTLLLLTAAGVPTSAPGEFGPPELPEIELELPFDDWSPDPEAPPFTLNDLIDFHFQLEEDEELHGLLLQER
jgi:predicted RNA-binding Zn-ribbon protein involved in translation (DUF1610 family)